VAITLPLAGQRNLAAAASRAGAGSFAGSLASLRRSPSAAVRCSAGVLMIRA
jgi:hypothetical protein